MPKRKMFNFEIDDNTARQIKALAGFQGKSKSETLRWLINYCHSSFVQEGRVMEQETITFEAEFGDKLVDVVESAVPKLELMASVAEGKTKKLAERLGYLEKFLEKEFGVDYLVGIKPTEID